MTTKYGISFRDNMAWLELLYEDHELVYAKVCNNTYLSPLQQGWVWGTLVLEARKIDDIERYAANSKGKIRLLQLPLDTSFETFWTQYANKVGKKERTTQLWKLLSDEDKSRALAGIKRYKNWLLQNPSVQMLYPETYISQKRWENEY